MTNEELILKFYDGDETILEKLYNKISVLSAVSQRKLPLILTVIIKSAEHRIN